MDSKYIGRRTLIVQLDHSLIWRGSVNSMWAWRGGKFLFLEQSLALTVILEQNIERKWSHSAINSCSIVIYMLHRLFDLFKLPFGKQGTGTLWVAVCRAIYTNICTLSHSSEVDQLIQTFHLITSLLCTGGVGGGNSQDVPSSRWSPWTYRHYSFTEINEKRRRYKLKTTEAPSRFDEYLVFPGVNNHGSDGGCGRGDGSSNFCVAVTKAST